MTRRTSGSVLILALVTVMVASLLAVGAAAALRGALAEVGRRRQAALETRAAYACLEAFAHDILAPDTNGLDHAGEIWRQPFPPEEAEKASAFLAPEFPEADAAPCADEESRLPLNAAPEEALAALIAARTGRPAFVAATLAGELAALRPIPRREFVLRAPSLTREDYDAIAPFVTAAPTEAVNPNTASRPVLEALFAAAGEISSGAAGTLARKIFDFRAAGGHFESLDLASLDTALGGLNQAETEVLRLASGYLTLQSRHFSAVARSGAASVVFTYDREEESFSRVAASQAGAR